MESISNELVQDRTIYKLDEIISEKSGRWEELDFVKSLYQKPYKLFVWKDDKLIFWNHDKDLSFQNIHQNKSDFHYSTAELDIDKYRIEILYPVIGTESHMVNQDLLRKAGSSFDFIHTASPSKYTLKLGEEEASFSLKPIHTRKTKFGYIVLFFLFGISLVFFLIHFSNLVIERAGESSKLTTIGFYLLGMFAIKYAISILTPANLSEDFILFSENNSFAFYHSIADFLLSSLFIFIAVISMNKILANNSLPLKKSKKYWLVLFQWSIIVGFLLIISASRGLVLDTNMHFNVEEVYHIDKYSLISITAVLFILFSLFNYSNIFSRYVERFGISGVEKLGIFTLALVASLPIFYYLDLNISIFITYGFLVIYFLLLDMYMDNNHLNAGWLIFWMVVFSGFTSVVFYNYSLEHEILERKQTVLSLYTAPANEDIAYASKVKSSLDSLNLFNQTIDNNQVPIGLRKFDLIQYFNQKLKLNNSIDIESFDKRGKSIFSRHYLDESRFLSSFVVLDSLSSGLFYDPFTKKYLLKYTDIDTANILGNSYVNMSFSKSDFYDIIDSNFKNNNKTFIDIKSDNKLLFSMGDYEARKNEIRKDNNELFGVSMGGGELVVDYSPVPNISLRSYKKIANIIKPISFFSYIFTLVGILILISLFLNFKYNFLSVNINFDIRHSLRLKIQFTLILLIILSFVSVGALTSYYFKNLIKKDQLKDIRNKTEIIYNDININLKNISNKDFVLEYLSSKVPDLAKIHGTELLLFSKEGRMLNTSDIKQAGAIMDYPTWFDIRSTDSHLRPIHKKRAGDLWESFIPVFYNDNFVASINVKHNRASLMNNSILEFFSTLLNVYVLLFLLAGFIAIAVSNSITKPLKLLANKIVDLKLGKKNETIPWKGNDEIGLLINSYNEMLVKIDNSAQMLAKTQRDQAWREMAKQVAHEIKNPLTPMKLSMQYLEQVVAKDPSRAKSMIPRISKTLIEQIDNLTGIADAFSNFAKMPKATNEKVCLNEVVETTHDLFREREDLEINLIEPIEDLFVFADKNHLVRILNNLLKNAMQAIPPDKRGVIKIELFKRDEQAVIKITDNGTGISNDMLDKVFTPNFTTKSSGTGLGLPIVANMIETFNGKIYFETEVGIGTSFYVEIPTMRSPNMEVEGKRVSLD